jgi:chloramphenicol 3-O phosphotransferase
MAEATNMLIYLNGTSSSGKTTIALELQKLIPHPTFYFSIDALLYSLPKEDLEATMGKRPYRFPVDWNSIFSGYLSCVSSLIQTGNGVIADCPIYDERLADYFNKFVSPLSRKFVIGIDCPLPILEAREGARKDRASGIARRQFSGIHKYIAYDFKVRTDFGEATDLAQEIFQRISSVTKN